MASGSASAPVVFAASAVSPFPSYRRSFRWQGMSRANSILVQTEVGPQINPPHVLVRGQLIWCAAAEDRTVVDDVCAVGDPKRLAHIVIGDEHADSALLQVKDDLLNIGDSNRIDAGERFVEQHEAR